MLAVAILMLHRLAGMPTWALDGLSFFKGDSAHYRATAKPAELVIIHQATPPLQDDGYEKGSSAYRALALVLIAVTPACPGVEHILAAGYDPVE
jgi:hypothetical protein